MRLYYLLLGAILFCNVMHSQTLTVRDEITLQPIPGAMFRSIDPALSVFTDNKGSADISVMKGADSIEIVFTGYHELWTSYETLRTTDQVLLKESAYVFNEVVISANRFEAEAENIAQPVELITASEIAFSNAANAADLIQTTGNVLIQKSQLGGGSPIIRGFEANKVLLVVDGIRMNNAIYRGGHLQNIITLDNATMERVEILYGPGSVMYGSDALGGVMHFFTKNPILSSGENNAMHADAFARYSSAADEKTAHLNFSIGGTKLGSLTSITYSDFGDLRQGSNRSDDYPEFGKRNFFVERQNGSDVAVVNDEPDLQVGSAYSQYDFMQKFTFQQSPNVSHQLNFQYSSSSDVPRYDRLTESSNGMPRFAEWYYGPQKRLFGAYALNLAGNGIYDHAHIIAGYQNIEESRHDRRFQQVNINHRTEQLDIFTFNADFSKMHGKNEWRYGIEAYFNDVQSTATKEDITTGQTSAQTTRYPDGGSGMNSAALYLADNIQFSPNLIINGGLRLNYISLNAKFIDKTFFPFPFDEVSQNNTAVSGSLGLVYKLDGGWKWNLLGSTGFRAPNVDDLSKVFESVPGTVIVPNPDLGPEHTYNVDLGVSKTVEDRYSAGVEGFYTWYRDAITTQPGLFNGESQIDYDGQLSEVRMNVNAGKAFLYGINAHGTFDLGKYFSLYSTINYTYGRIETDSTDYPLDHIAPLFGKTSLDYKTKQFKAEVYAMYNGWKKLKDYNLFGEDNFSFATPEGMPAWMTLNLKASYQINPHFVVQAGIENILDKNYRVFASNISAPGRNFILTARYKV
jgi:hemoglobin/transferrin/lactoferrin receptor protein